jgi:hypothetical protein
MRARDRRVRWSMSVIKATPAQYLGQVFATNEAEAIKEAAKDWNWSTSYGLIGGQVGWSEIR